MVKEDRQKRTILEDHTLQCPWCKKPKKEYKMKGEESDDWYYIEGSIPVPHGEVAGDYMGGQMHQVGYQGGNAGMMHGGVAGEHMGGQVHQGRYQASSLGSSFHHQHGQASNSSETERAEEGKARSVSEPFSVREERAIIAQFWQAIPYKDMSNHIDILNKRSANTLRNRFENIWYNE